MNWSEPLDRYCERLDSTFLSEPFNLFTNLAFILAALSLWRDLRKIPLRDRRPGSFFLVAMIFIIGLGSSLFHSIATRWAQMADVIPIAIFVLSFLYCSFRWEIGAGLVGSLGLMLGFGALSAAAAALSDHDVANGSEMYFGTWITLFGLGCYLLGKPMVRQRWLTMGASLCFSASMVMRPVDMRICVWMPVGTHFMWHILNGLTLYLVTKSYIINARLHQVRP